MTYVSACPGTFSDANSVTVTNPANGATATVPVTDGGFDPVTLEAQAGDELEIAVHHADGSTSRYPALVPARKRPRVVRTLPPKDATDVVLSASVLVVFSEPVESSSVTPENIRLLLAGEPVVGTLSPSEDGLRVEFVPAEPLQGGRLYILVITTGVHDLDGDALEEEVQTTFATEGPSVSASVSSGHVHTCAATGAGRAYCWGSNNWGQLGLPATGDWSAHPPTRVPTPTPVTFTTLSAGGRHTCALGGAGSAWCWGLNEFGALGDGTTTTHSGPVSVSGGHSFVSLAAGSDHTCGLTASGTAYCWGVNHWGQLGTNEALQTCFSSEGWRYLCSTTPVPVGVGLRFTSLAAGKDHTCGITTFGTAYCWGLNSSRQLGVNASEECSWQPMGTDYTLTELCSTTPIRVSGGLSFYSLGAGYYHTCGITTGSRAAYCWGVNDSGQLGTGQIGGLEQWKPVAVVGTRSYESIVAGWYHTCGLTISGEALCWGSNNWAELGIGVQGGVYPQPVQVSGNHVFEAPSTWTDHVCGLTADGDVYCWGYNESGTLGIPPCATPGGWSAFPVRVAVPE